MAFPHWPDRLGPHCEFPPSDDPELEPPPDYDPPTCDPLRNPADEPKRPSVRKVIVRILLILAALIAAVAYWQL